MRRFDAVFAAQSTKAPHSNSQDLAGVLVVFVDPRPALDLRSGYAFLHRTLLLNGCGHPDI